MRRFLRIMVLEYQESLKDWNADDFFNYEFIRQKDGGREERGIMNDELKDEMRKRCPRIRRIIRITLIRDFIGLKKLGSSEYGVRSMKRTSPSKYMKDTEIEKRFF